MNLINMTINLIILFVRLQFHYYFLVVAYASEVCRIIKGETVVSAYYFL